MLPRWSCRLRTGRCLPAIDRYSKSPMNPPSSRDRHYILQPFNQPTPTFKYVAYPSQPAYGTSIQNALGSICHHCRINPATLPPNNKISTSARSGRRSPKNNGIHSQLNTSCVLYSVCELVVKSRVIGEEDDKPVVVA